jgi:hypothetical protein
MNDGATLAEISGECLFLAVFTLGCLALAAFLFSWND